MRVEDISQETLRTLGDGELKELRLRCRQLFRKYSKIEEKEQLVRIDKGHLEKKYDLLMAEFESRRIPYTKWEIDKNLQGIYLVPPHGEWIWEGEKTLIVKARAFKNMVGKPLILISGDQAYGIIKLKVPKQITLEEFRKLECEHRISERERKKWWPDKKSLYAYEFTVVEKYEAPKGVEIPQGVQTFIQDVVFPENQDVVFSENNDAKFEKAKLRWELEKPGYRIFEVEDLKNTPGFQEGKVIVEAKFDGVRARVEKHNGKAIIFTDPEETSTPNKSVRLPHQIAELEKMYNDNFTLDAEIIMLSKDGDEVLHRTAVNALINGKFDPTEQSKRAQIYVFDILELDGNSTVTWPLKERKEALGKFKDTEHIRFVRPTTTLTSPGLSFVVPVSAVERAMELVMKAEPKFISEGAMIKLLNAPYSGKAMLKWKQKFEIDCLVVGRNEIVREGKKTANFNYLLAVGPLPKEWASAIEQTNEKAVVEYGGKKYNYIGKSDNTKQSVAIGSILRVASEDVNRYETDDPEKPYFKAYVSVVMQPVPERKSPDTMQVVERLSEMTARREEMKKGLFTERELRESATIESAVKASIENGKIPKPIYQKYAKEGEPLPEEFYTDYQEGDAWAQTHIRGLKPDEVEKYEKKQLSLAELMEDHSIHVDLRMNLGKKKLIQWVILDNDIPSYVRYLKGELRETAGGKNVQHSMAVVKPSAEEPQKLKKAKDEKKEKTISAEGAKMLAEIQMIEGSYFIPPGGVGATPYTYSWMGLIWKGKVKSGIQRKDYHEYFLYPGPGLPEENREFFNGRFVFKCLKRKEGTARWETWKATSEPLPQDPIEHKDGGYYYPVKTKEVKAFGREKYSYGKKEPI